MSDRVPIGTHPGLVTPLLDVDVLVAEFAAPVAVQDVFLRRGGHGAGDVVSASLRNATGGGGDGIAITLGDGVEGARADGPITGTTFYLRVSATDPNSANLTGWFGVLESTGATTALTSVARVKEFLKITASTNDGLLADIVAGVSAKMQRWMRRAIVEQSRVDDRYDGYGRDLIVLRDWPVTSVSEVRESGVVVDAAEWGLDVDRGMIYGVDGRCFERGRRNLGVDLVQGYSTVPADLSLWATVQAAYVFKLSTPGDARLGERGNVLDAGGSSQYLTGGWAPGVVDAMTPFRGPAV